MHLDQRTAVIHCIYRHEPDAKEVNVDGPTESPLEDFTELDAFVILTLEHIKCIRNLLEIVQGEQANLFMTQGL